MTGKRTKFVCTLLLMAIPASLFAQGLTGEISGRVRDSAGAVISGAQVTIANDATGQIRGAATSTSGEYVVTDLLPGTYSITVINAGFRKYQQSGIALTATERVVLR